MKLCRQNHLANSFSFFFINKIKLKLSAENIRFKVKLHSKVPGVSLVTDVGVDGHPGLRAEVGLVGSNGFTIVTVYILLQEPVSLQRAERRFRKI